MARSPSRRYDASRRRAQAQAARERVLAAATDRFSAQGYAATTIAQVAADAGVSSQTVFAGFGTKARLLGEAVERAIVGDLEPVGLHERAAMRRVYAAKTASGTLRRFAAVVREVAERAGPIALVAYAAADADPEVAAFVERLDQQRLLGATSLATLVADRLGDTDPDRIEHIRDVIWLLNSPLQYRLLVVERGWSLDRYAAFVERSLVALAARRGVAG